MVTWMGLAGATLTVTATTLDDAIWLVPYLCSPSICASTRIMHAILFVCTLESLALFCVGAAGLISRAVLIKKGNINTDMLLGLIGALLCWMIAGALYGKKIWKRRQRRLVTATADVEEDIIPSSALRQTEYQAIDSRHPNMNVNEDEYAHSFLSESLVDCGELPQDPSPSPWTVISLTALGALDEVSYFPALVVGKVFTPVELLLGTFLAACIILTIVMLLLAKCEPLMRWLDEIPLYGVVALFATVLTIGVTIDFISGNRNGDS